MAMLKHDAVYLRTSVGDLGEVAPGFFDLLEAALHACRSEPKPLHIGLHFRVTHATLLRRATYSLIPTTVSQSPHSTPLFLNEGFWGSSCSHTYELSSFP